MCNLKKGELVGKMPTVDHLSKHASKLPKPSKKAIIWVAAIAGVVGLLIIGLLIAGGIWLFSLISSSDTASQVTDMAKQSATQVVEGQLEGVQTDPLAFIQNGQVDTAALQEQVQALSPQQLILFTQQFTSQVNQLLESGQLAQEQANQLLQLIPQP